MSKGKHQAEERSQKGGKKKKSHRLYAAVVLILAAAILVLGILILFYRQAIEVSGNDYCTEQEIVNIIQEDKYSINTIYAVVKYAAGYGEKLPCLESMKVGMKNPWTLKVTVKEKQIVGYVKEGKKYFYFDKNGMVVYESNVLRKGLPSITGVEVRNIQLYETLECDNAQIFEEILETSKEVKKSNLNPDKIVCEKNQIYLYIGKVRINLGNSVSSEQVAQIKPIMEKLGEKEGTLHLENYSEDRTTITFDIEEISE
ncbi:MAG: hypothetical protein SOU03_13280 [Dorea sp.]|nr:hypothetical protein [Dorea sp.]